MTSRERFLNAFTDSPPDRPPAWIMRQAGRYLPEYRELKTRYDFLTLVKTPELAAEVTLQPLRRFPQLDAAIIFSDILIIPEALGIGYRFREAGGIEMEKALATEADVKALDPAGLVERTAYLPQALAMVRETIGDTKALLGFAGSPWTLATYLIEGGSTRSFERSRAFYREQPHLFHNLMERLVEAVVQLFTEQIKAGVDAVQIFDSWASAAPEAAYSECSLRYIREIIERLPASTPVILFAKGMTSRHRELIQSGARALAVDHSVRMDELRAAVPPDCTLQGNLDPAWMTQDPESARQAAQDLLIGLRPFHRYIFNLGHGITPQARIETVQAVLETVDALSTQSGT